MSRPSELETALDAFGNSLASADQGSYEPMLRTLYWLGVAAGSAAEALKNRRENIEKLDQERATGC